MEPASTLSEQIEAALPEQLRPFVRWPPRRRAGELTLVFELPRHPPRTFDAYLMVPGRRALARIGGIGFGYRVDGDNIDHATEAQFCRAVARALHTNARDALEAYLREPVAAAPRQDISDSTPTTAGASLLLNEATLVRGGVEASLAKLRAFKRPLGEVELFLNATCVQSCSFCVFPLVRESRFAPRTSPDATAWVESIMANLRARGHDVDIVLSGADCLRHPQLDAILRLFEGEHEIGLRLLGPLTRLSERDLAERVASLPSLRGIRLSLFGARAETHDRVVGIPGAHAQVLEALANCRALGIIVGLSTVVTAENVAELPELLALVRELGLSTELNLFHPESWSGTPMTWREVDLDRVIAPPGELLAAFERTDGRDAAHARTRYVAHCWVPTRLHATMVEQHVSRDGDFSYAPACSDCAARADCPGISRPALEHLGPGCARPIP